MAEKPWCSRILQWKKFGKKKNQSSKKNVDKIFSVFYVKQLQIANFDHINFNPF